MAKTALIHMVGTRCPPDKEARFDTWYNERHVPDLMKFKKLRKVTRFRSLKPDPGSYPRFLTIYEFAGREDFEAYFNSPERAVAAEDWKKIQQELGASQDWAVQYEVIRSWEK